MLRSLFCLLAILLSAASAVDAALLGPSSYLGSNDSALVGLPFAWYELEDFEDGALDTPGVSSSGVGLGVLQLPNVLVDSVDADDGIVDGSGSTGKSYYTSAAIAGIRFIFDPLRLPTHAGIVWTDASSLVNVTFEAFDAFGNSLGTLSSTLGDGVVGGQTAEDKFFGAVNLSGISEIRISQDFSDMEVDHLQYGSAAIPEPASITLVAMAFGALLLARKR